MIKNWQTSAGAVGALLIIGLHMAGVNIPGVQTDAGALSAAIVALVGGLLRAKDKDVTGAGDSAQRVK